MQFWFVGENEICREIKNCDNHNNINDAENEIWPKIKLVIVEINDRPSIHVGDSGIENKSI